MNTLLIDIGNSRVKWARMVGETWCEEGAFLNNSANLLHELTEAWSALDIERAAVTNVAQPTLVELLSMWLYQHKKIHLQLMKTGLEACGVKNTYETPFLLGVDRWAAVIGAWSRYQAACCIFDCGTTITCDIVNAEGALLGGTISPGLQLMVKSLTQSAEGLKNIPIDLSQSDGKPLDLLGKVTVTAITQGCLKMAASFLESAAEQSIRDYGVHHVIITGGDASALLPYLSKRFLHIPLLVLEGVGRWLNRH